METREFKNTTSGKIDVNESFLASAAPSSFVRKYWKHSGLSDNEAEKRTKDYQESLEKIIKATNRFVTLVERKYSYLDDPELVKKGLKFAKKHEMSNAETQTFIKFVLKGEVGAAHWPIQEMQYTEMAKFLGFSDYSNPMIMTNESDKPELNKLYEMYEQSKNIHAVIKNQLALYRDCAPEAIMGAYDKTKHSNSLYIHPLVAALYLPKICAIENKTLNTNIGRMILQKTYTHLSRQLSAQDMNDSQCDMELSYAIARDPNSLQYISKETPLSNLIKRFKIQIELWKNVHNLRQGKFYSSGEYDVDDSITGFLKILNSYSWTYFDSPDMYQVQDEGTVLRKFLATFSIRPTYVQLSSPVLNWNGNQWQVANYLNVGRVSFMTTPVLNLRLPNPTGNKYGVNLPNAAVMGSFMSTGATPNSTSLRSALDQQDIFWENRSPTVKSKNVIYSNELAFFYVNRKYQSIDIVQAQINFQYLPLQNNLSGISSVNTHKVDIETSGFTIGQKGDMFDLVSAVLVQVPPANQHVTTGCSSIILKRTGMNCLNYYYNPQMAGIMTLENNAYVTNQPITSLDDAECKNMLEQYGTVYIYVKQSAVTASP